MGLLFNLGSARPRWAILFSSPVGFQGPLVPCDLLTPVAQGKLSNHRRQQPPCNGYSHQLCPLRQLDLSQVPTLQNNLPSR